MSKKWTKLPRGVTWKQVNESMRRRKFLDKLKHSKHNDEDYLELRHDGTDFSIETSDFTIEGWFKFSGDGNRCIQTK